MNATLTSESAAPDAAGADDVTSEMTAAEPADTSPVDAPVATGVPDSEPATANSSAADPDCAARGPSALVDRKRQRAWLCTDGQRVAEFPVTTAWSMPDPGRYKVYAKDLKATSSFGGHFSRMTHFVAFSYGKRTGARVAFHSLPKLSSGQYVQPENSVGKLNRRGESNGCIRMLDADVVKVWDHLQIGDPVIVLN